MSLCYILIICVGGAIVPYYLSYIEVNGHASMMLSHQETPTEPAKVVYQVGFAYLSEEEAFSFKFKTFKGQIFEEDNAAKALYSSSKVRHKTYEISTAEMQKFFTIMNRDKRQNISEYVDGAFSAIDYDKFIEVRNAITDKKLFTRLQSVTKDNYQNVALTIEEMQLLEASFSGDPITLRLIKSSLSCQFVASGPNYQLLRNNCKTYTLGVFKELGIVEASTLSNFAVQRTGTTKSQLHEVSSHNMTCSTKDNALQKITDTLIEMARTIENIENRLPPDPERFAEAKRLIEVMQDKKKQNKIGVREEVNIEMKNSLKALYEKVYNVIGTTSDEAIHDLLPGFHTHYKGVEKTINRLIDDTKQNKLQFSWKGTPELSVRLHLEHFTPVEKAIYTAKMKTNEFLDGCSQMHQDLNDILLVESSPKDLKLDGDVKYLQTVIMRYQDEIMKTKDAFEKNAAVPMSGEQVILLCHKQNRNLQLIMLKMENELNVFKPASFKTFAIMRYINKLIAYFKKDYHPIENPTHLIRDKLKIIKHSVEKSQVKLPVPKEEKPDPKMKF